MDVADITQEILFGLQLIFGFLGNLTIMLSYLYVAATKHILKPVDLTVLHLAFANLMTVVFMGMPQVMFLFGVKQLFTNAVCKAVKYIYRVARAVSVSTTCTLSVFQSATIAPLTSCLGKMKLALPKYLIPSFSFFWTVNFVSYIYMPLFLAALPNNTYSANSSNLGLCYIPRFQKFSVESILAQLFSFGLDLVLMLVMVLASGHILLTLKRHHQHAKYIKSSQRSHMKTAEEQAADTVIKLVTLYIVFYGVDMGILTYTIQLRKEDLFLSHVRVFFSCCYPALSPIIMSSLNKKLSYALIFQKKNAILSV